MNKIILCEQNMIEFNNCFTYSDGTFANISIRSIVPKDKKVDLEDLEKTLRSVFSNLKGICNINNIVWLIRTIFINLEEKELTVQTGKDNNITSSIYYKDYIINKYEKSFDHIPDSTISYELGKKTSFLISDISRKTNRNITSEIENEINSIVILKHSKGKSVLFDHEQHLCKAYSLFYGESPDFREKDNVIKAQVMSMILHWYEVPSFHYTGFSMMNGFPNSLWLSDIIYSLRPLGLITNKSYDINLDEIGEKIEKIGSLIKENVQENFINEIMVLGSVLCAMDRRENKDISEATGYDKESIQKSLYLIEKIQQSQKENVKRRRIERIKQILSIK